MLTATTAVAVQDIQIATVSLSKRKSMPSMRMRDKATRTRTRRVSSQKRPSIGSDDAKRSKLILPSISFTCTILEMALARSDLHCIELGRVILLLTLVILYFSCIASCLALPASSIATSNGANVSYTAGDFHCVDNVNWTGSGILAEDCRYAIHGVSLFEVSLVSVISQARELST